jgi:hypothetical protein
VLSRPRGGERHLPPFRRTNPADAPDDERELRLAAIDAAIERGLADIKAGRVHDADTFFDELEARYTCMARARGNVKIRFSDEALGDFRRIGDCE